MKYSEFETVLWLVSEYEETRNDYMKQSEYENEEYNLTLHEYGPYFSDDDAEYISNNYDKQRNALSEKIDKLESDLAEYVTSSEIEELDANRHLFDNYFVKKTVTNLSENYPDADCNIKGLIEIGKEAVPVTEKIVKQISDDLWGDSICSDEDLYEYLDQHPELSTTKNKDTCKIWGKIEKLLDETGRRDIGRSDR